MGEEQAVLSLSSLPTHHQPSAKSWYGIDDLAASEALLSSLPPVPSLPEIPSFLLLDNNGNNNYHNNSSSFLLPNDSLPFTSSSFALPSTTATSTTPTTTTTPFDYTPTPLNSITTLPSPFTLPLTTTTPSPLFNNGSPNALRSDNKSTHVGSSMSGSSEANVLAKEVLDLAFGLKLKILEQHSVLKQLQQVSSHGSDGDRGGASDLQQEIQRIEQRERLKQEVVEREHKLATEHLTARVSQLEDYIALLLQQQQQQLSVGSASTTTVEGIDQGETGAPTSSVELRSHQLEVENEQLRKKVEALEQKARADKRRIEELLELNEALKMSISEQILPSSPPHHDALGDDDHLAAHS